MVYESAGPDDPQGCGSVISKEFMPARWAPTSYNSTCRGEMTPVNHLFCRPFKGAPKIPKTPSKGRSLQGPTLWKFLRAQRSGVNMSSDAVFSTDHQVFGREALSVNHRQGNAEGEVRLGDRKILHFGSGIWKNSMKNDAKSTICSVWCLHILKRPSYFDTFCDV